MFVYLNGNWRIGSSNDTQNRSRCVEFQTRSSTQRAFVSEWKKEKKFLIHCIKFFYNAKGPFWQMPLGDLFHKVITFFPLLTDIVYRYKITLFGIWYLRLKYVKVKPNKPNICMLFVFLYQTCLFRMRRKP